MWGWGGVLYPSPNQAIHLNRQLHQSQSQLPNTVIGFTYFMELCNRGSGRGDSRTTLCSISLLAKTGCQERQKTAANNKFSAPFSVFALTSTTPMSY